jgi:hypothetical protein
MNRLSLMQSNLDSRLKKDSQQIEHLWVNGTFQFLPSPFNYDEASLTEFFNMMRNRRWRDTQIFTQRSHTLAYLRVSIGGIFLLGTMGETHKYAKTIWVG